MKIEFVGFIIIIFFLLLKMSVKFDFVDKQKKNNALKIEKIDYKI